MKLNWGTGIAIFYSLFAATMVGMVVYSKNFDHSLVVKNYYEEDLKYQSHIDKVNNANQLATDLQIVEDKAESTVRFEFPTGISQVAGQIVFYKPDDESKDFSVKIKPDETGKMLVPTADLTTGRWTVKVDWQGDGKAFYKEETLVL